jgi:hypothetical protein
MPYDDKFVGSIERYSGVGTTFERGHLENAAISQAVSLHRIALALERIAEIGAVLHVTVKGLRDNG